VRDIFLKVSVPGAAYGFRLSTRQSGSAVLAFLVGVFKILQSLLTAVAVSWLLLGYDLQITNSTGDFFVEVWI